MDHIKNEALFILQGIILIGLPYLLWRTKLIRKYLPLVVMQIILGIFFGPSILGKIYPNVFQVIFPAQSVALFSSISWLALILFGFLTGLHFNTDEIKGRGTSFMAVSLASIFVPFTLGGIAGWWIFYNTAGIFTGAMAVSTTFIFGLALDAAVTALPVLGAILMDMKLIDQPIGRKVIGYATINDGLLWMLLAIFMSLSDSAANGHSFNIYSVFRTIIFTAGFMLTIIFIARPFLLKLEKMGKLTKNITQGQLVLTICLLFLAALITDLIGVHYLLGAFVFGAVIPKTVVGAIQEKIEPVVLVILLPFFFMATGLKTLFDISQKEIWALFALGLVISLIGKIIATSLAQHWSAKSSWLESFKIGGFMQTKGLMDVIILNILFQAEIINSTAFSALLLVAVATTALTKPFMAIVDIIFNENKLSLSGPMKEFAYNHIRPPKLK